jgi:hypothetical protein
MPERTIELPVDITPIRDALQQPLNLVEPAERRASIQSYLDSAAVFLERAVVEFLSALAAQINADESDLTARVEYRAGAPCFVIEVTEETGPTTVPPVVDGDLEKVTIRLPGDLKVMVDRLASGEGVSANSWYIRELARTIRRFARDQEHEERHARRRGNRSSLRGFVGD